MWKTVTARSEADLCAELNRLGVEVAQIVHQGARLVAFYFERAPKAYKTKPKEGDK